MKYDFDKSIGKLTQQVSKTLGKRLEEKFVENGYALKAEEWSIISMLYKYKKQSQRDISLFMALDKVRIKRIIDRLEKAKLVNREESESDKRFNNITLTSEGMKLYRKLVTYAEDLISKAMMDIPTNDVETCLNVLELIKENLIVKYS